MIKKKGPRAVLQEREKNNNCIITKEYDQNKTTKNINIYKKRNASEGFGLTKYT